MEAHKALAFFKEGDVVQFRPLDEVKELLESKRASPCGLSPESICRMNDEALIVAGHQVCGTHSCTEIRVKHKNGQSMIDIRLLWYPPRLYGDPLND